MNRYIEHDSLEGKEVSDYAVHQIYQRLILVRQILPSAKGGIVSTIQYI